MAERGEQKHLTELVHRYFALIRELRKGDQTAVEKLTAMWDEEGVFDFVGAPPVVGTFSGRMALQTLYKNRAAASRMPLELSGSGEADRQTSLGLVDTEVQRVKVVDPEHVVVSWTTIIGTSDKRGFQVSGSHAFTLKDGRIGHLKVVVSPRPEQAANLALERLGVDDIGRLALAAWPVV